MTLNEKYNIPNDTIITIGGMVGIGKSTITNSLADALNFRTSLEKVDTNPYLDKFYHDFERWSFHLQIYFLAERFKSKRKSSNMAVASSKTVRFMRIRASLRRCITRKVRCHRQTTRHTRVYSKRWCSHRSSRTQICSSI